MSIATKLGDAANVIIPFIPELIAFVRALRSAHNTDDEVRVAILSRTDEITRLRAVRDAQIDEKFGPATEAD